VRRAGHAALGAVLVVAASACGRDAPPTGGAAGVLGDPSRHLVAITAGPSREPRTNYSLVLSGRVSASGRHVALVDLRAPYVRVYRRDGQLRSAFLKDGRGPAEARGVAAIALGGDSLVLVADIDGRVRTFDLDGRLRQDVPDLPLSVVSATSACPGEWLLYGARVGADRKFARWLHRLRIGAGGVSVSSMLEEPFNAAQPRRGPAGVLVSTPGGAALWHGLGGAPRLATWTCGAESPVLAPIDDHVPPPSAPGAGGTTTEAVQPGTRMRAGLAAARGALYKAEIVSAQAGSPEHAELAAVRPGSAAARLPGSVLLLDSRPGVGVLVQVFQGQTQRVLLISEQDFLTLTLQGQAKEPRD
jgi:hypothetical protein